MARDLTAIVMPEGQWTLDEVRALVRERPHDVILRVAPLAAAKRVQVEVCDARTGLPCEDPQLVAALSERGRAAFLHVNHEAGQALVHSFSKGDPEEGYSGKPGDEFAAELEKRIGVGLEVLQSADDGSRLGIGISGSHTVALVRGAVLTVPAGLHTSFDDFTFHDRAYGISDDQAVMERVVLFAFDEKATARAFFSTPGSELAARLEVSPSLALGPLESGRREVVAALRALGGAVPQPTGGAGLLRALELCTFAEARVFAGGEEASYFDERILPLLSLLSAEGHAPVIDADDADELEECESVFHAMVEVLPFAAPPGGEGALLTGFGPDELAPLEPRFGDGAEYAGSIFRVDGRRLFERVSAFDGERLTANVAEFERAWYRAARPGLPEGDALALFRQAKAEAGQRDVERFLTAFSELATLLRIAVANGLDLGILFYGA